MGDSNGDWLQKWIKGEKSCQVVIKNEEAVLQKIKQIKERKDLQIVADFDMTLTKFMVNGSRGKSSHRVIEDSEFLSDKYRNESKALFEHYYPIEISQTVPVEEKVKLMTEWWTKSHELIQREGLRQDFIKKMVSTPSIALREGAVELIKTAHDKAVPFHIFSAGIYDVIHAYLEHLDLAKYGPHVVSNMMEFDPNTHYLVGFKGSLIHTFNKNGMALRGSPGWANIEQRKSVVLLGDSLTDVAMISGLESEVVLNIAFLNDRIAERLPEFQQAYDVVLLNDAPCDFVLELVDRLL